MFSSTYMTVSYFSGIYFGVFGESDATAGGGIAIGPRAGWVGVGVVRRDAVASGTALKVRASIRAGRARGDAVTQANTVECSAALSPGKAGVHIIAASQIVEIRAVIIDGSANGVDTVQDENNFLLCMAA